jgi:GxxExxY protein
VIKDEAYYNSITEEIIGSAYKVGNSLGTGFLEKVYENAFFHELSKTDLHVEKQVPIQVHYDQIVVGDYFADLIVENEVIVELKAVKSIDAGHFAQCMNYLKATNKKICLLINFGSQKVEIKRYVNYF